MKYDVIIVGAGPAGLTAGIFASRAGLKVLCIERLMAGGQMAISYEIANYPGFDKVSGFDLGQKMQAQAEALGVEFIYTTVEDIVTKKTVIDVVTKQGIFKANKVILAIGCTVRKLGLDNEEQLTGRGVSYCASCDGNFFKNKTVAVVGGGDTAVKNVDYLINVAKKVYMLNRSENFKANEYQIERIKKYKNLKILTSTKVKKLVGKEKLEALEIETAGANKKLKIDGLFVAIGYIPKLEYPSLNLNLDKNGYIIVDDKMRTSAKNIYACGDIISKSFRQIITAAADGAIAGNSCMEDK